MFHGCFKGVLSVFQGNFKGDKRMFIACFKEVSGVCQKHFKCVSKSFKGISRLF